MESIETSVACFFPRDGGENDVSSLNNLLSSACIPDDTNNSADAKAFTADSEENSREESAMETCESTKENRKQNGGEEERGEKDDKEESGEEPPPSKRTMPAK